MSPSRVKGLAGAARLSSYIHHFMYHCAWVTTFGWWLASVCPCVGEPSLELALVKRFKAEAPLAWKRCQTFATAQQGTATVLCFDLTKGRTALPYKHHVKFLQSPSGAWWSLSRWSQQKHGLNVQGVNSKYAFELQGNSEKALSIKKLAFLVRPDTKLKTLQEDIRRWTSPHLFLDNTALTTLIEDPAFTVIRVAQDAAPEHEQALKVEYELKSLSKSPTTVRNGEFRVDPAREWILLDYRVRSKTENVTRLHIGKFEYALYGASPVVKRHVRTVQMWGDLENTFLPGERKEIVEYDLCFKDRVEEGECTLSAFGLREISKADWEVQEAVAELLEDDTALFVDNLTNFGVDDDSVIARNEETFFSGVSSISVTEFQRFRAYMPNWSYQIAQNPKPGEFRYLRFAWKRTEAPGIMLQLHSCSRIWHRYYAGRVSNHTKAWGSMIHVAEEPPRQWKLVTRDLFRDFGPIKIGGISLTAMEGGGHAYFDHIYLGRTIADLDRVTLLRKNVAEGPGETDSSDWTVWVITIMAVTAVAFATALSRLRRWKPGTK